MKKKKKNQSPRYQLERMIQRLIEQQGTQLDETDRELLAVGRSLIDQLDAFRAELAQARHGVNVLTQELSQTNATVQTRLFWKLIQERDEMKVELQGMQLAVAKDSDRVAADQLIAILDRHRPRADATLEHEMHANRRALDEIQKMVGGQ